ncbi:MAG TPA: hypothetical protein VN540_09325 [Clostridia bacterium]|nr:hypothetical protein [Clostridia bacterium]
MKERIPLGGVPGGVLPSFAAFSYGTTKKALGFESATIILIWPAGVKAIKPHLQDFSVEMKDLLQDDSVLFFSRASHRFCINIP